MFRYGDILNNNLSPTHDKQLNMLIYWTSSYVITYRSYKLLNMVRFSWPTLYINTAFLWLSRFLPAPKATINTPEGSAVGLLHGCGNI